MLTLPGTPVLRYGDEIGMGDDLSLPERQCARTPMQWTNEVHGGFTTGKPVTPVISEGPYGYRHCNAADQRRDSNSLLNWLERVIRMRKEVPEVAWGDFSVIDAGVPQVLAIRYVWRNNTVVFLHNLGDQPCEIRIDPDADAASSDILINLLSQDHSPADESGQHVILLEPYGYRWFRVGGLDALLRRSDV